MALITVAFAGTGVSQQATFNLGPPNTGTSMVEGLVTDDEGRPLMQAYVAIFGADLGGARSVLTNEEGRFVIRDLPPGAFTLAGSKPGYATWELGQALAGNAGTKLNVQAGARVTANVILPRTARISGMVHGVDGQPANGISINVYNAALTSAPQPGRNVNSYAPAREGQFTLIDLPPGSYIIEAAGTFAPATRDRSAARVVTVAPGQEIGGIEIQVQPAPPPAPRAVAAPPIGVPPGMPLIPGGRAMPPGGAGANPGSTPPVARGSSSISGVVLDANNQPVAGVEVRALTQFTRNGVQQPVSSGMAATTDAGGVYHLTGRPPGAYQVAVLAYSGLVGGVSSASAARVPPATIGADGLKMAYTTTYFPSATRPADAQMIALAEREDRVGIDIRLQRAKAADVSGRIQSNFGGPGATVMLMPADVVDQLGGANVRRAAPDRDARFTFADVTAGRYVLVTNGPSGSARVPVEVTGAPMAEIVLAPAGRVSVRGSLQLEGIAASDAELAQVRVRLDPEVLEIGAVSTASSVSAQGTFVVPASPGRYRLHVIAPAGWVQVSGRLNDQESLDAAVEITGDVTGALVILAANATELLGTVRDAKGQPTTATVVIFPADQAVTSDPGRRLHVVRAQDGGFNLTGLPPGKYWAAVGDADMVPGRPVDRARLAPLVIRGVAFELKAGEHRSVQILWSPL